MNGGSENRDAGWAWEHTFQTLPEIYFQSALPEPAPHPALVIFNDSLSEKLGLDGEFLKRGNSIPVFTGNVIPRGAKPIAQAYAGHQYGGFTGLGDGRAILLGEHISPSGARFDIQLKGSGRTAFSRGGDGKAALAPMLREYLISEAMHALGIPSTRSLAVATTGETVLREKPLPGAVLTRVAASHIRVGTFQWAAAHEDLSALEALAHYARRRHFPDLADGTHFDFFEAVLDRQAFLIARWMCVGFVHGVMNTDNMAISGETIDYGPCAFLDRYDSTAVFSSIDRYGRYAYNQQASIARWNLARLAEAMLPLFDANHQRGADLANAALGGFMEKYQTYWLGEMRGKLGLSMAESEDESLITELLDFMHQHGADFTNTFRELAAGNWHLNSAWLARWRERLAREKAFPGNIRKMMDARNPAVIPRNHLVEEALAAAQEESNFMPFYQLLAALQDPFRDAPDLRYSTPPPKNSPRCVTYCGT